MAAPSANGLNGGRVLRVFQDGAETLYPGQELSAEQVLRWPTRNRKALESAGRVMFYNAAPAASVEPVLAVRRGRPPGAKSTDALFQ